MSRMHKKSIIYLVLFCLFLSVLARPSMASDENDFQFVSVNDTVEAHDSCHAVIKNRNKGIGYVALIIDDMGPSKLSSKFIAIKDIKMSLSFLPYSQWGKSQSDLAYKNGHEIMLHMPMQPLSDMPKERYMILETDTTQQAVQKLKDALQNINHVKGVNNHMGSLVTAKGPLMDAVLDEVKAQNLYFVDSKTSGASIAEKLAYKKNMKAIGRHIFLDDKNDKASPYHRLKETANRAFRKGYAVAIGHPLRSTYADLQRFLDEKPQNIKFVKVSEVIEVRDCLMDFEAELEKMTSEHMLDDIVAVNYEVNNILSHINY